MLRRLILAVLCAGLIGGLGASPAAAGGWWSHIGVKGRYFGVGEEMSAKTEVLMISADVAASTPTKDGFFVYLLKDVDTRMLERAMSQPQPGRWWSPPEEMHAIGDVSVGRTDSNLVVTTTTFTIPDVPEGSYWLMLCDLGCKTPMGDIVPSRIRVLADPVLARTARRVDSLGSSLAASNAGLRHRVRRLHRQVEALSASGNSEEVEALRERVKTLEAASAEDTEQPVAPGWFLAGAGASALVFLILRRRTGPSAPREVEGAGARDVFVWADQPGEPDTVAERDELISP